LGFKMQEKDIDEVVRKLTKEREQDREHLAEAICKKIDEMNTATWKLVAGVDIHDQNCVNKFNNLIKDMFEAQKHQQKVIGTFLQVLVKRATDAVFILLTMGMFYIFIGG